MTIAAPGEILISGRLRKAIAADFIIVEARPSMAIKGKTELLPVFAVLGLGQQRAIRLQEPAYALVMIGRNREMALLEEKLQSVLGGHGQIIGVTAEAGMGKSRLVAEGIRLARRSGLVGYGGACQSDGTNTPYLVWQPIWNAFFDLDPSLPLRKQIRSLEGELADRVPEHADALPLLGTVLGLSLPENDFTRPLQPKDRKTQLETMLVKCLESAAREAAEDGGGLLLVLEDLHWIDQVSFDLLELIGRAIEQLPVLVLLTYRGVDASLQGRNLTRLESLDQFSQIKLKDLNAQETEQVIRSKLFHLFPERGGVIPQLLIERITRRAQGNPFYVEELLNYLHDRGIELGDAEALEKLDLPTSLYSLILSRIDQLATSQQLTLKVASIIGRIFRFDDLHYYYPPLGFVEHLQADLSELERLELTPLESPEPELTYLFKHLVTHEVSYESLSFATRAQLHGQYARYLERAYPERVDQLASQLAHHFERGQIQDKARFYLMKAGERAAANFANEEALAYFNRALNLALPGDVQERFDTLLRREGVFDLLGKHTEQRRDLAELDRLASQLAEPSFPRALIGTRQAKLEIDVGDYSAAISRAQAAIQEIEGEGCSHPDAPDLLVDALLLEARARFMAGQAAAAGPQLEKALTLARQQHYVRGEYNALAQQGLLSWHGGEYSVATELLVQSLSQIQQAGDIRRELEILNNLGIVAKARSQYSEAIGYYERAQKIALKIGDRSGAATLLNNMGSAGLVSGDFVLAAFYSEQAAAIAVEVNEPTLQGMALTNRGEAYRELGQYELANTIGAQALALTQSSGYRRGEAIVLDNLGLVDLALGNYPRALERIQAALDLAREIGSRYTEAYALLHLGSTFTETGQFESAEQALIGAGQIVQGMDEEMTLLEVQPRLANLMLARGGDEDVERAHTCVSALISSLLQEAPPDKTPFLPLWLYLTCIRVLQARHDPRAEQLLGLAKAELRSRSEKITDPALRQGYLNIPEHMAILNLASAFSLPEI
jgi:predicted ATPase